MLPEQPVRHEKISIHALREEGDQSREELQICIYISIHALREEGDNFFAASSCRRSNFYPRPPRGGRPVSVVFSDRTPVISIHALREEGDLPQARFSVSVVISIHALREEGDPGMPRPLRTVCGISIHALREEGDILTCLIAFRISISIHALREEGDGCWQAPCWPHQYFYPRPPRGGRRRRNLAK